MASKQIEPNPVPEADKIPEADKLSLRDLTWQANELMDKIHQAQGEITPEIELALSKVDLGVREKIDGYAFVLERLKSEEAFFKAQADKYAKVAKASARAQERLKTSLKEGLLSLNQREAQGLTTRITISPTPEKLELDEKLIPNEYRMKVTEWVPDKERIKEALERLRLVDGAKLVGGWRLCIYPNRKVIKD